MKGKYKMKNNLGLISFTGAVLFTMIFLGLSILPAFRHGIFNLFETLNLNPRDHLLTNPFTFLLIIFLVLLVLSIISTTVHLKGKRPFAFAVTSTVICGIMVICLGIMIFLSFLLEGGF